MKIRDAMRLGKLAIRLRSIWSNISKKNPITPTKVITTMKIIWKFFGGSLMLGGIVGGALYFKADCDCGPDQVLAAPAYELLHSPRPVRVERSVVIPTVQSRRDYDVEIIVESNESISYGSGTLFRPDAISTCNHLFVDGGKITVRFQDGTQVDGILFDSDKTYDVACVVIAPVIYKPAKVSTTKQHDILQLRGMSDGKFNSSRGKFKRWARPSVQAAAASSACFAATAPGGNSGGGIFNDDGLYGIVWGSKDGETYGTSGAGFRSFVNRWNERLDARPSRLVIVTDPNICIPCRYMDPILFRLIGEGYQIESRKPTASDGRIPRLLFFDGEKLLFERRGFQSYNDLTVLLRKPDASNQPGSN